MIKYGIKIWSTDKDYFKEAFDLFKQKEVDFIELYLAPDLLDFKELESLKEAILAVHSPHDSHNFDIFDLNAPRKELFKNKVIKATDFLRAEFIIVHAGIGNSEEVFKKNTEEIHDQRILIENMPKVGIRNELCFGYSLAQLEFVKKCGYDICLDFQHASKSAVSQGLNYKSFIESLIDKLNPYYFHISGGDMSNEKDYHLDLFDGNFDSKWAKEVLDKIGEKKDIYVVFEVPKGNGLRNDIKNINYFRTQI